MLIFVFFLFPDYFRVQISSPTDFFESLKRDGTDNLCTWIGELYLELHQGTFTTQAKVLWAVFTLDPARRIRSRKGDQRAINASVNACAIRIRSSFGEGSDPGLIPHARSTCKCGRIAVRSHLIPQGGSDPAVMEDLIQYRVHTGS